MNIWRRRKSTFTGAIKMSERKNELAALLAEFEEKS
jgi:hypothetical protein